jgi:hypothetical protein
LNNAEIAAGLSDYGAVGKQAANRTQASLSCQCLNRVKGRPPHPAFALRDTALAPHASAEEPERPVLVGPVWAAAPDDWLPQPRNFHPWPQARFAVKYSSKNRMPELGLSASARGAVRNHGPYRDPESCTHEQRVAFQP